MSHAQLPPPLHQARIGLLVRTTASVHFQYSFSPKVEQVLVSCLVLHDHLLANDMHKRAILSEPMCMRYPRPVALIDSKINKLKALLSNKEILLPQSEARP